ncbi:MAG: hypothetical protein MI747_22330 [Desulfobacterales bacterium]|nr:hypothetical protein [Desulfobacterales bacterium]
MALHALNETSESRSGDLMVAEGLIHPSDITRARALQKQGTSGVAGSKQRLFGMVLCDLNLVTPMDSYCVLKKHGKLLSLEEGLVRNGLLSTSEVEALVRRAGEGDAPLISLLLDEKQVPRPALQQLLFDLFHIPLRSISDIIFNSGLKGELGQIISSSQARQHGMIPLILKEQVLLCGITDPDNLIPLKELDGLFPQYRFKPVFIPYSGFSWFFRLLYGEDLGAKQGESGFGNEVDRLLDFSVTISDPLAETDLVHALYHRYERLRQLGGMGKPPDRRLLFQAFIQESHSRIRRAQRSHVVAFGLERHQGQIRVKASPLSVEERPWQK